MPRLSRTRYHLTLVGLDRRRHNLEADAAPATLTLPFDTEGSLDFSGFEVAWRTFARVQRGTDWATYEEALPASADTLPLQRRQGDLIF